MKQEPHWLRVFRIGAFRSAGVWNGNNNISYGRMSSGYANLLRFNGDVYAQVRVYGLSVFVLEIAITTTEMGHRTCDQQTRSAIIYLRSFTILLCMCRHVRARSVLTRVHNSYAVRERVRHPLVVYI